MPAGESLQPKRTLSDSLVNYSPNFIVVDTADPRTSMQFLRDTIASFTSGANSSLPKDEDFALPRPTDGRRLDDTMALTMRDYFVAHGEVKELGEGYEFIYGDSPLKVAFGDTWSYLGEKYGFSSATDHQKLTVTEYIATYADRRHYTELGPAALRATERGLLNGRLHRMIGGNIMNNVRNYGAAKRLTEALAYYPPGELEHLVNRQSLSR